MDAPTQETIVLDVLRVASTDVLGQTKPLSVAAPFCFGNAKGDLKRVEGYEHIQKMAAASAASFKTSLSAK
jgi:hypothetical protein